MFTGACDYALATMPCLAVAQVQDAEEPRD